MSRLRRQLGLRADDRGVTPAVGKALEVAVVVLLVGTLTTALYGGAVPDYRDTVGAEVGDRTLVAAAERVENAVPPSARSVRTVHAVDLPRSIRGENYRITANDRALVLEHPSSSIGPPTRLALPDRVETVEGAWRSSDDAVVLVRGNGDGLRIELVARDDLGGER
ncbi:MAG: DUF7266 family protein [Halolamina sp.]